MELGPLLLDTRGVSGNHLSDARRFSQLCTHGKSDGMNPKTAAYASAQQGFAPAPAAPWPLERGKPKPEAQNLGVDKTSKEK